MKTNKSKPKETQKSTKEVKNDKDIFPKQTRPQTSTDERNDRDIISTWRRWARDARKKLRHKQPKVTKANLSDDKRKTSDD
jgi:hypothetical protein